MSKPTPIDIANIRASRARTAERLLAAPAGSVSPSVAILATVLEFAEATKGMRPKAVMCAAIGVIHEMQRIRDEAIDDAHDEATPNR